MEETRKKGFAARLHFLLFGQKAEKPRCPPSGANPSVLAGQPVDTEDDVLHIQELPTFDRKLKPQDSELLLQYLTVRPKTLKALTFIRP